jgi:hypothetical protein
VVRAERRLGPLPLADRVPLDAQRPGQPGLPIRLIVQGAAGDREDAGRVLVTPLGPRQETGGREFGLSGNQTAGVVTG